MDLPNSILQSPLITRLGWTLLHSLWQIAIISAILVIALRTMRSRDPRWRYSASCVALLASLLFPAITFTLITNNAPASSPPLAASQIKPLNTPDLSNLPDAVRQNAPRIVAVRPASQLNSTLPPVAPSPPSHTDTFAKSFLPTARATLPWLVLAWALGVLALSIWNLGGWLTLHHLRFRSTSSVPINAQRTTDRLCTRFNLSRPVRLLQSTLATTPLVLGAFRPIILLPASVLTDLSIAELESILAHELAHIRRHDYLVNLIQSVVETLLFYHPAIWWISRQIRIEREHCCDDLALTVTRDRATYVTALAAVASVRVPLLAPAASGGKLLPRLRRVLGIPDTESRRSSHWLAGALVTACFAIAAIAPHLQSTASAADKTPPATQPSSDDIIHVRGRVLDPDGKPLSGAKVNTAPNWWPGPAQGHPAILSTTTTNADGRFEISFRKSAASPFILTYGQSGADCWKRMQITATAKGFGMDWQAFDHVDAAGEVVLRLPTDLPLNGRIVDLEGRPVSTVTVIVDRLVSHLLIEDNERQHPPDNYRSIESPLAGIAQDTPIVSDADGRFQITGLGREREANLKFRSNKIALLDTYVMTRPGQLVSKQIGSDPASKLTIYPSTFVLTAPPARVLTGIVRDAHTHKPIARAKVETSYSLIDRETFTDEQGHYSLDGLDRSHDIEITITSEDQPYVPAIFDLPPKAGAEPAAMDVDLIKGIWITGKVTDSQTRAPIAAAVNYLPLATNKVAGTIPALREGRAQPPCNTQTHPDGSYRLVGLGGPGIVVVQVSRESPYTLGQGFDKIKTRDSSGRVATIFPGLVSPEFETAGIELDAPADATLGSIDFSLMRGNSLRIACTDPDGKPLKKLLVIGNGAAKQSSGAIEGSEFDAVGFLPNETRLIVICDDQLHLGKIVTIRPADARAKKLSIMLEPMASITGRLVTPDHDPIREGRLRIDTYVPELRDSNHSSIASGFSSADGRFIVHFPGGCRCVLGAMATDHGLYKWISDNIDLKPGTSKNLGDIELTLQSMK